jgi:hypothetical protein
VHHELTLRALRLSSIVPSARGAEEAVEAHDAQKLLAQVDRLWCQAVLSQPELASDIERGVMATMSMAGAESPL